MVGVTDAADARRHHVLLIEDDPALGRLVSVILSSKQYRVTVCQDSDSALLELAKDPAALVLLDLGPPMTAGPQLDLLRDLRGTPVVVLTDTDSEEQMLGALSAGAFDIARKPFSPDDLEAFVALALGEAVQRQTRLLPIRSSLLDLDFETFTAVKAGRRLQLSFSEWRFLQALAARVGQPVLYQEILRSIYGRSFVEHLNLAREWAGRVQKSVGLSEFHGIGYALKV